MVAVYLDGTSIYTVTNDEGVFRLSPREHINTQLVFSHVGYRSFIVENPFSGVPDKIYLEEKPYEIENIVVEPVPFSRQELLRVFRESFLGKTRSGRSCRIENEDDIQFSYNRLEKRVWAYSDVPLRIRNRYLGYDLLFNLMHFQINLSSHLYLSGPSNVTTYYGTSSYQDRQPGNKRYQRRREEVHSVSVEAFYKDLAYRSLRGTEFIVLKDKIPLDLDSASITITDTLSMKKITIGTQPKEEQLNPHYSVEAYLALQIAHKSELQAGASPLLFLNNEYVIDSYGRIDKAFDVMIGGAIGERGVGGMLPLDFIPE